MEILRQNSRVIMLYFEREKNWKLYVLVSARLGVNLSKTASNTACTGGTQSSRGQGRRLSFPTLQVRAWDYMAIKTSP